MGHNTNWEVKVCYQEVRVMAVPQIFIRILWSSWKLEIMSKRQRVTIQWSTVLSKGATV